MIFLEQSVECQDISNKYLNLLQTIAIILYWLLMFSNLNVINDNAKLILFILFVYF